MYQVYLMKIVKSEKQYVVPIKAKDKSDAREQVTKFFEGKGIQLKLTATSSDQIFKELRPKWNELIEDDNEFDWHFNSIEKIKSFFLCEIVEK